MTEPTIYLDTNIFSAFWYEGHDIASIVRRLHTREWWEFERSRFRIWVSVTTVNELEAGQFARQSDCVKTVCRDLGLRAPLIVSPESIPQRRWGQTVRRPDHS
jgi:hypothetical protein